MLNLRQFLVIFILLALALPACTPAERVQVIPSVPTSETGRLSAEINTNTSTDSASAPVLKTKKPPQTKAAGIIPPGQRQELTRLSSLLKFKIVDREGVLLGQVSDFIINTCETYIIYFTVTPVANLKVAAHKQLVIPFEVVTINSGELNAVKKTISLYMTPDQVSVAPPFADHFPLFPNNWEELVRTYWLQVARVSPLTSECKAGGSNSANAVHKIAYATQLLGAELKDGNQVKLGTVVDAVLEPESGKLGFYVVRLLNDSLVMVPLGQTNIPKAALVPGKTIELVLLAETNQLLSAPHVTSVEQAMNTQTQRDARQYWKN
jgi:sporulation protein YlmC with PRC-barrel domain